MLDQTFGAIRAEQINIGLSSIIGVTVIPGQVFCQLQKSSGGTLFVGGISMLVGGTFGYHFPTAEVPITVPLAGTFYLAANGATAVCYLMRGLSPDGLA